MRIEVDSLGKQFLHRWVFRGLSVTIPEAGMVGVSGPNGSGKSTLMKILAGAMPQTEGEISYFSGDKQIEQGSVYRHLTYAAPYMDLIEELSLAELLSFHFKLRKIRDGFDAAYIIDHLGDKFRSDAIVKTFSSGMKQRLLLSLALHTDSDIVFLDEPTSNLDDEGKTWFARLTEHYRGTCTIVIASNDAEDMRLCTQSIHLPDFSSGK